MCSKNSHYEPSVAPFLFGDASAAQSSPGLLQSAPGLLQSAPGLLQSAPGLLQSAAATMEARGAQYDQAGGERSMGKCVAAFNIITGRDLQESEGWLLLQLLKDVRDRTTPHKPHEDSLIDGVAYAALKAEARLGGK